MLLLPEGRTGEAWEPSTKHVFFGNREALDRKLLSPFTSSNVKKKKKNYKQILWETIGRGKFRQKHNYNLAKMMLL